MKKKIVSLVIIILIIIGLVVGFGLYRAYSNQKRYKEIKNDIQEEISRYLKISSPYCSPSNGDFVITDETLIYQGGMDEKLLLDIDGKSYCNVRIEVTCIAENQLAWNTYLSCNDYEDFNYTNWES